MTQQRTGAISFQCNLNPIFAKYTLTGQIHLHIHLIGIADCIPYLTIPNTSPRVTWHSKKSVCVSRKVYQRSQSILESSRTGWPFCDKAFTFGCSQEAAETLITHSPPAFFTPLSSQLPIHPWTLDQNRMFIFFSLTVETFGGKLNLTPKGTMENWAK